ncbi:MAG: DNA polymerase III subunit alpha [Bacteroidia bacterium]
MLNNHTYFSHGYGAMSPEELLQEAKSKGWETVLLTDINTTAAVLDFIRLAEEQGIRPVVGIDFRIGVAQQFVALARNNEGFREMNEYLSLYFPQPSKGSEPLEGLEPIANTPLPPSRGDSFAPQELNCPLEGTTGVSAAQRDTELSKSLELLESFHHCYLIYPFLKAPQRKLRENEFIGIRPSQLNRLRYQISKVSKTLEISKLVVMQPGTFRHKRDFNAHRLLRAIDLNTLLSKLPKSEEGLPEDVMWCRDALRTAFSDFPEIIANTERLLEDCSIHFTFGEYSNVNNKRVFTDSIANDRELIRSLCEKGMAYRFPNSRKDVQERVEKELEVIEQRDFLSYFLINWDIVNYARRNNYFYVGRGSGANSMIAYLLRITDVDPIELDLYFERFINPSRKQPPDFDIDFSWRDREDVTRYIFETYPNAVLVGSHTTFKQRAVMRELGKVLGLPPREINKLSQPSLHLQKLDDMALLVLKYSRYIQNFPHHKTIHSSGILIPEKSIFCHGATFMPPKGFPTTHFDMYISEDVGLHKFDILGQRGLGKIKDALEVIRLNNPAEPEIDIHNIEPFKHDERVKAMLRNGETMACFYVESPAMRSLLTKLHADTYLGLVAASSIIRPGVAQSGMMQEYIKRFRHPETRKYIHPKLGELMHETFGVMVYQEDVLKVAHYFAGLTLAEADVLRRGMSWKFRERNAFWKIKDKFFSNCHERGYEESVTGEVWRQIESFGNYAFAKGHSASYAVESYQSLYLKAHFPLEYLVATINNGGGFYTTEVYVHEAHMQGGIIEAPCVNNSDLETCIKGRHIYLGLNLMKDLEARAIKVLLTERERLGEFVSLGDFVGRVEISLEQLIILIRINGFRSFGIGKKELLWEAHFLLGHAKKSRPTLDLFITRPKKLTLPKLEYGENEDAFDEIEILGFPLSSPFSLLDTIPRGTIMAQEMPHYIGQQVRMTGYLVHVKNLHTRSKNPQHMQFGTFIDEEGHFIDSVHFPNTAARYPFRGRGCYLLTGKIIEEYDFVSLETHTMEKIPLYDMKVQTRSLAGVARQIISRKAAESQRE